MFDSPCAEKSRMWNTNICQTDEPFDIALLGYFSEKEWGEKYVNPLVARLWNIRS